MKSYHSLLMNNNLIWYIYLNIILMYDKALKYQKSIRIKIMLLFLYIFCSSESFDK